MGGKGITEGAAGFKSVKKGRAGRQKKLRKCQMWLGLTVRSEWKEWIERRLGCDMIRCVFCAGHSGCSIKNGSMGKTKTIKKKTVNGWKAMCWVGANHPVRRTVVEKWYGLD